MNTRRALVTAGLAVTAVDVASYALHQPAVERRVAEFFERRLIDHATRTNDPLVHMAATSYLASLGPMRMFAVVAWLQAHGVEEAVRHWDEAPPDVRGLVEAVRPLTEV